MSEEKMARAEREDEIRRKLDERAEKVRAEAQALYDEGEFASAFEVLNGYSDDLINRHQAIIEEEKSKSTEAQEELKLQRDELMLQGGDLIDKNNLKKLYTDTQKETLLVGRKLSASTTMEDIYMVLDELCEGVLKGSSVALALIEGLDGLPLEGKSAVVRYVSLDQGSQAQLPVYIPISSTSHVMTYAIRHDIDIIINSFEEYAKYISPAQFNRIKSTKNRTFNSSSIYMRLVADGEVIGIFTVQRLQEGQFTERRLDAMKVIALFLSITIKNVRRNEQILDSTKRLESIALMDELVNLENRRAYSLLIDEIEREDREYMLIFFDMNHLKQVNDGLGHASGDAYLKTVAEAIDRQVRGHRKFRISGDEFLIVAENISYEECAAIITIIKNECARAKLGKYPVSVAAGAARRTKGKATEKVFAQAEARMYLDKALYYKNYAIKRRIGD